ncbi:hypothetical protein Hanom_Chr12g01151031 [Helianthus anomalus]
MKGIWRRSGDPSFLLCGCILTVNYDTAVKLMLNILCNCGQIIFFALIRCILTNCDTAASILYNWSILS